MPRHGEVHTAGGPPWGRVDTNDLHTAALRRRPAAGGPRRWGSALQGSQGGRGQRSLPKPAPLPPHPWTRCCSCTAFAATGVSVLGQGIRGRNPEWGLLFPQPGALSRVESCLPWLGDAGCRWLGSGVRGVVHAEGWEGQGRRHHRRA